MSVTLRIHMGHVAPERMAGHDVRVDGRSLGQLSSGEVTEFEMEPGFHIVEVHGGNDVAPMRVHARPGHPVELVFHEEHPGILGLFAGGWFKLVPGDSD